jgi:hypothetical protein
LLCPGCHKLIDDLEPEAHPVERLAEMKNRAIERGREADREWADDGELVRYARLAIDEYVVRTSAARNREREDASQAVHGTARPEPINVRVVNGHVDVFACGHRRSSLVAIESLRV